MKRRGFLGAVAAIGSGALISHKAAGDPLNQNVTVSVPAGLATIKPASPIAEFVNHHDCAGHLVDNETGERTCVARITATGLEVKEFTDSWMSGRPHTLLIPGHETDWFHLTCWHGVGPRIS